MEGIPVENATGLIITPVPQSGIEPFIVYGAVGYKQFSPEDAGCDDGIVYYCCGRSFPSSIATVI